MMPQDEAARTLKHYLKIRHNVDEFEINNINGDTISVDFIFKDMIFNNDGMRIVYIDFYAKKIYAAIDIDTAKAYLQKQVKLFNSIP